ncbi:unnamed protein product, partial [Phaeothamnion confervicola]
AKDSGGGGSESDCHSDAAEALARAAAGVRRDGRVSLKMVKALMAGLGLSIALPLELTLVRTWSNELDARRLGTNGGGPESYNGGGGGGNGGEEEQQRRFSDRRSRGNGHGSYTESSKSGDSSDSGSGARDGSDGGGGNKSSLTAIAVPWPPRDYDGNHALDDFLTALFTAADADGGGNGELAAGHLARLFLSLNIPCTKATLRQILTRYDADGSGTIALPEFRHCMRSTLLGRRRRTVHSVLCDADGRPWAVPETGTLRLVFREEPDAHRSVDELSTDMGVGALVHNIRHAAGEDERRRLFVLATTGSTNCGVYYSAAQAQALLEAAGSLYAVPDAVAMLLPQLFCPAESCAFVDGNLDLAGKLRLRLLLGQAWGPIVGMATGHYALDMQVELDRQAGVKLAALATQERQRSRTGRRVNTSQRGDWLNFRNATFNRETFSLAAAAAMAGSGGVIGAGDGGGGGGSSGIGGGGLTPAWFVKMPPSGVLAFDYVSNSEIDQDETLAISDKRLEGLLSRLGFGEAGRSHADEDATGGGGDSGSGCSDSGGGSGRGGNSGGSNGGGGGSDGGDRGVSARRPTSSRVSIPASMMVAAAANAAALSASSNPGRRGTIKVGASSSATSAALRENESEDGHFGTVA